MRQEHDGSFAPSERTVERLFLTHPNTRLVRLGLTLFSLDTEAKKLPGNTFTCGLAMKLHALSDEVP